MISELKDLIIARLDEAFATSPATSGRKLVFHVSTIGGSPRWVAGAVHMKRLSNGAISGEHHVFPPPVRGQALPRPGPFSLCGNLTTGKAGSWGQIVWQGRESQLSQQREVYVASFVGPLTQLAEEEAPWVGIWSGKATWDAAVEEDWASMGLMVVVHDNDAARELLHICERDMAAAGSLAGELLGRWDPHGIVDAYLRGLPHQSRSAGMSKPELKRSQFHRLDNPKL